MQLIYEGVDILPEIRIDQCYHELYAKGHSDELLIRFEDQSKLWDKWQPRVGDRCRLIDEQADSGTMYVKSLMPSNGMCTLRALAVPAAAKRKKSKTWEQVRFFQLIEEIASRHRWNLQTFGMKDRVYTYVRQENQSDLAFLNARCLLEGTAFLVFDDNLVVYDELYMESMDPTTALEVSPSSDFEYKADTSKLYDAATITNGTMTGRCFLSAEPRNVLMRLLHLSISSQAEADRFARGVLRAANQRAQVGVIWDTNMVKRLAPGSVVYLRGDSNRSWDGPVFIERIRHEYMNQESKLFFRKVLVGY